jgi:hypothetical protein
LLRVFLPVTGAAGMAVKLLVELTLKNIIVELAGRIGSSKWVYQTKRIGYNVGKTYS